MMRIFCIGNSLDHFRDERGDISRNFDSFAAPALERRYLLLVEGLSYRLSWGKRPGLVKPQPIVPPEALLLSRAKSSRALYT